MEFIIRRLTISEKGFLTLKKQFRWQYKRIVDPNAFGLIFYHSDHFHFLVKTSCTIGICFVVAVAIVAVVASSEEGSCVTST